MQPVTRLGVLVVLIGLTAIVSAPRVEAQTRGRTTVTRLYTGAGGESHAEDTEVTWRPANLRPELSDSEMVKVTGAQVLLAEDTTGKGHTTRVGPDEDLVMLLVPLAPQP